MTRATYTVAILTSLGCWSSRSLAAQEQQRLTSDSHFIQYGVSFVAENVVWAGDVCPVTDAATPCVLGSGFGATIRLGYRSRSPWYFGGAYEFSHHDSSNLLRLAILQQLRAEGRYYFDQETRLTPYASGALGAMIYGNEWGAKSGGPSASLGVGLEYQADASVVVGLGLSWRTLVFRNWTDTESPGIVRRADRYFGFGLGHLIALELTLEVRNPLPRW